MLKLNKTSIILDIVGVESGGYWNFIRQTDKKAGHLFFFLDQYQ